MALAVDYTKKQMMLDVQALLQAHPGPLSGRPLGNPTNVQLYTPERLQQLWEGVCTAWARFFRREFPSLREFARVVLCECAQESTMDYRLGVRAVSFQDHTSHGVIQVTPGSVLKDYSTWGTPIKSVLKGRTDVVIADPAQTLQFDTSDMCLTITLWAWYTSNCVKCGVSLNEYAHRKAWHIQVGGVPRTYANCLLTWLAGPRNDTGTPSGAQSFADYYARICDYYVQGGFGTREAFDAHLATQLRAPLRHLTKECVDGTAA